MLDPIAPGEFSLVEQCIGKSRKSLIYAIGFESVAQEVFVKFALLSSGVGVFWLSAIFTLGLSVEALGFEDCSLDFQFA